MSSPPTSTSIDQGVATDQSPLVQAFLAPSAEDVFHSVSHRHQIWKKDPYDIETIHAEARGVFEELLNTATTPPGISYGRILLILGEAGAGKTHLMRAFRNSVHSRGLGYAGYLPFGMTCALIGDVVLRGVSGGHSHD